MYSHLISMVFCTIFVFLFLIYYNEKFFTIRRIKVLIISTLVVTAIFFPYLSNILEHRLLGNYVVFSDIFSTLKSTMYSLVEFKSFYNQIAIHNNIMTYLNIVVIVLLILNTIVIMIKREKLNHYKDELLLGFAILLFLTLISSKYVWSNMLSFLAIIQFPWRLLIFLDVVVSLYAASLFLNYKKYKYLQSVCYVIISIIVIFSGINNVDYYGEKQYSSNYVVNSVASLGWQMEYLPVNSKKCVDYDLDGYGCKYYFQNRNKNVVLFNKNDIDIKIRQNN